MLGASDLWFWDGLLSSTTNSYRFDADAIAPSIESGRLTVWLHGASDFPVRPDHHLRVYVNGQLVGEDSWDGKRPRAIQAELPPGLLVEGTNTMELENVGDTEASYSMVLLDRLEVHYPRRTIADTGTLEGRFSRAGSAVVSEADSRAHVTDVTDASRPVWLQGLSENGARELTFRAEENRHYLVTTPHSVITPEVRRPPRRELETSARGADYVLIGPDAFSSAAEPLIELRRSQNLRSSFVSIEQIRDEFGFGEPRPEAIRDFLIHAYHEWPGPALRYVVLLGDGTYDYKDFLGTGVRNHVPPLMIQTSYLWTASDPTLAMVNGDDRLPDIAIGRLPAGSVEQLRALIDKILAFENGAASLYSDPFVLVADDPDKAGDFVANAEEIGRLVPPPQRVDKLYLSELGRASTRDGILRSFDEGASVMSYIGHGGIHLWADERIFSLDDIDLLAARLQLGMRNRYVLGTRVVLGPVAPVALVLPFPLCLRAFRATFRCRHASASTMATSQQMTHRLEQHRTRILGNLPFRQPLFQAQELGPLDLHRETPSSRRNSRTSGYTKHVFTASAFLLCRSIRPRPEVTPTSAQFAAR